MISWHHRIDLFEFWRFLSPLTPIIIYYHYYLSYIQKKQPTQLVASHWKVLQDLGSNPRSPHSSYYFLSGNLVHAQSQGPSCDLIIQPARWPDGQIQRPSMEEHHKSQSTCNIGSKKSSVDLCFLGPDCFSHLL